jgi:GrpB-like predicted nucleotidyltransferase (UPF0157 family)
LTRVGPEWADLYATVGDEVVNALGDLHASGALAAMAHVGSTAVPGILAKPVLDVMAMVHPYPLPAAASRALARAGFVDHGEHGLPGRTFFTRGARDVHFHVVGLGSDHWLRHLAMRDYLRVDAGARERYEAVKVAQVEAHGGDWGRYVDGKGPQTAALEREALAWWVQQTGFTPVYTLCDLLEGQAAPWAVGGGWALDLWSGAPSRPHADVDLVVDRADAVEVLRHLVAAGFRPLLLQSGRYRAFDPYRPLPGEVHRALVRMGDLFVDVAMEPRASGTWLYRLEPAVHRDLDAALCTLRREGRSVTVLAPEIVLLFKARTADLEPFAKDDADAAGHLAALSAEAASWLHAALERTRPDHPWVARLADRFSRRF